MKIMIHGAWRWPQYESAFARGLSDIGVEVVESRVFGSAGLAGRIFASLPIAGVDAFADADNVLAKAERERPDFILFWRPVHILARTLRSLRDMGITTASHNNDDPFSPKLAQNPKWRIREMWRLYRKALPEFDFNFFYRQLNCQEALAEGARHAQIMLPYFLPWQDRPVELDPADTARFDADLVFIGHYEKDGRDKDIRALINGGFRVRVWGDDTWRESELTDGNLLPLPIRPALGADYARALAGAKICLCYLSKLNRDGYTRRSFEIPAAGRVMLAERTLELAKLFREDEEACFFSSREELLAKARMLLADSAMRLRIAEAGRKRVWADGHDVASRARQFLEVVSASASAVAGDRG